MGATASIAFGAGLAAVKDGLNLVTGIRELTKKDKPDIAAILAGLNDLHESLCRARESLGDANDENRELRRQFEEQQKFLDVRADMEFVEDGGFYIRKTERAAGINKAYCPLCLHAEHNDVPLNSSGGNGRLFCAIHKATYETQAWRDYLRQGSARMNQRGSNSTSWMG